MTRLDERGFSLMELVMIIVIVGIVLPFVLIPFLNASKGAGQPSDIARLTLVARGEMDDEMETVKGTPPGAPCNGVAVPNRTVTVGTRTYTIQVSYNCYLSDLATVTTTQNEFILIDLTATDNATGDSSNMQALKSRDY